jgi:hypothetical protein
MGGSNRAAHHCTSLLGNIFARYVTCRRSRPLQQARRLMVDESPARSEGEHPQGEPVCDTDSDREPRFDSSASARRRRRESVGTVSRMVIRMTDERRFEELLSEFKRVGVDLDSFPAGITILREDALRILRSLPDDAGPAAFLSRVRHEQQAIARPDDGDALSAMGG